MKRVVITGIGAVTAFGKTWEDVKAAFQRKQNAVQAKTEWAERCLLYTSPSPRDRG